MQTLNSYRKDINSQQGEDGVLEYLCGRLDIDIGVGWCVEFGAWDGKHLSNTRHLIHDKGWKGVLIEGDAKRFEELTQEYADRADITAVCAFVGFRPDDENRLDAILKKTEIPCEFDILSIDVDGDDYYIWEALQNYKPKIVVIEANSGYDWWVDRAKRPGSGGGASARALVRLGRNKGYELVCHTGNCIFVRKDLYPKIRLENNDLKHLFDRRFVSAGVIKQLVSHLLR